MRRTPRNILFHELIGLPVRILRHTDPSLEGREGVVVWETRRTLRLRSGRGVFTVLKEGALLEINLGGGRRVRVRGDHLLGTPAERAKRIVRGR